MCGIVGGWFPDGVADDAAQYGLDAIAHRGPDAQGLWSEGPILLAMTRLSVLDIAGGQQPVHSQDGSLSLVHNGEVYNYRELSQGLRGQTESAPPAGDTAVLPTLFQEHGVNGAAELNGMFGIAFWDHREQALFLVRDRFGQKPLFYTRLPAGGFAFASELKALRPLAVRAGHPWSVRPQGIYDYLSLGVVPQPDTVIEGVHMLEPGCWLRFDGNRVVTRRYFEMPTAASKTRPYAEVLEETRRRVSKAVRRRLRSDVPLGVFLSGGVDSSVVAWEAAKELGADLSTFTVSTADKDLDELPVARATAARLGVRNVPLHLSMDPLQEIQVIAKHYDQPFADSSAIPSLAIARLAQQHVKVVLNGDGGDELFAGYRRYLGAALAPPFPIPIPAAALDRLATGPRARRSGLGFALRLLRGAGRTEGSRYLVWTTDMLLEGDKARVWRGPPVRSTEEWIESRHGIRGNGLRSLLRRDHAINLQSDLLVKMDMATMAASLEARSPLLDHELATFAATLPTRQLLRRGQPKAVLRDAYRGRLSDEVLWGRKRGFEVPVSRWLGQELQPLVRDTVLSSGSRIRDYLDPALTQGLFLDPGCMAEKNRTYLQYALLMLELWLRQHP